MPDKKNEKEKINQEGQQDRKGNYDLDGVSYSENEVHVGSENSDDTKSSKKSSDSKKKAR